MLLTLSNNNKINNLKIFIKDKYFQLKFIEFCNLFNISKTNSNFRIFKNNMIYIENEIKILIFEELNEVDSEEEKIKLTILYSFLEMFFNFIDKKYMIKNLNIEIKLKSMLENKFNFIN